MTKILLVEDDFDVAQNICDFLGAAGLDVEWAPDGLIGLDSATRSNHDLFILDIALPRITGVELCTRLRGLGYSTVPILMLTGRSELADKLDAFDAGADDYVVKPFALEELEVRIHALLRRADSGDTRRKLRVADLEFDTATQCITRAGQAITLTATGRRILDLLMRNSHRLVSRAEIEQAVWDDDPPRTDALRIHIHTLRAAVDKPFEQALIVTVRGSGYRITANEHD